MERESDRCSAWGNSWKGPARDCQHPKRFSPTQLTRLLLIGGAHGRLEAMRHGSSIEKINEIMVRVIPCWNRIISALLGDQPARNWREARLNSRRARSFFSQEINILWWNMPTLSTGFQAPKSLSFAEDSYPTYRLAQDLLGWHRGNFQKLVKNSLDSDGTMLCLHSDPQEIFVSLHVVSLFTRMSIRDKMCPKPLPSCPDSFLLQFLWPILGLMAWL